MEVADTGFAHLLLLNLLIQPECYVGLFEAVLLIGLIKALYRRRQSLRSVQELVFIRAISGTFCISIAIP